MVNKLSSGAAPYTPATLAANTAAQNAAQNTSFNISAAQGGDTKAIAALSAQGIPVAQVGEGVYTRTYVGNDVNTAYSRAQSGGSNYSLTYSNQAADNLAQQDTKTQLQNAAQKATTYNSPEDYGVNSKYQQNLSQYQKDMKNYDSQKAQYDKDLEKYNNEKNQYDKDLKQYWADKNKYELEKAIFEGKARNYTNNAIQQGFTQIKVTDSSGQNTVKPLNFENVKSSLESGATVSISSTDPVLVQSRQAMIDFRNSQKQFISKSQEAGYGQIEIAVSTPNQVTKLQNVPIGSNTYRDILAAESKAKSENPQSQVNLSVVKESYKAPPEKPSGNTVIDFFSNQSKFVNEQLQAKNTENNPIADAFLENVSRPAAAIVLGAAQGAVNLGSVAVAKASDIGTSLGGKPVVAAVAPTKPLLSKSYTDSNLPAPQQAQNEIIAGGAKAVESGNAGEFTKGLQKAGSTFGQVAAQQGITKTITGFGTEIALAGGVAPETIGKGIPKFTSYLIPSSEAGKDVAINAAKVIAFSGDRRAIIIASKPEGKGWQIGIPKAQDLPYEKMTIAGETRGFEKEGQNAIQRKILNSNMKDLEAQKILREGTFEQSRLAEQAYPKLVNAPIKYEKQITPKLAENIPEKDTTEIAEKISIQQEKGRLEGAKGSSPRQYIKEPDPFNLSPEIKSKYPELEKPIGSRQAGDIDLEEAKSGSAEIAQKEIVGKLSSGNELTPSGSRNIDIIVNDKLNPSDTLYVNKNTIPPSAITSSNGKLNIQYPDTSVLDITRKGENIKPTKDDWFIGERTDEIMDKKMVGYKNKLLDENRISNPISRKMIGDTLDWIDNERSMWVNNIDFEYSGIGELQQGRKLTLDRALNLHEKDFGYETEFTRPKTQAEQIGEKLFEPFRQMKDEQLEKIASRDTDFIKGKKIIKEYNNLVYDNTENTVSSLLKLKESEKAQVNKNTLRPSSSFEIGKNAVEDTAARGVSPLKAKVANQPQKAINIVSQKDIGEGIGALELTRESGYIFGRKISTGEESLAIPNSQKTYKIKNFNYQVSNNLIQTTALQSPETLAKASTVLSTEQSESILGGAKMGLFPAGFRGKNVVDSYLDSIKAGRAYYAAGKEKDAFKMIEYAQSVREYNKGAIDWTSELGKIAGQKQTFPSTSINVGKASSSTSKNIATSLAGGTLSSGYASPVSYSASSSIESARAKASIISPTSISFSSPSSPVSYSASSSIESARAKASIISPTSKTSLSQESPKTSQPFSKGSMKSNTSSASLYSAKSAASLFSNTSPKSPKSPFSPNSPKSPFYPASPKSPTSPYPPTSPKSPFSPNSPFSPSSPFSPTSPKSPYPPSPPNPPFFTPFGKMGGGGGGMTKSGRTFVKGTKTFRWSVANPLAPSFSINEGKTKKRKE